MASKFGFTPGATERKREAIANQYNTGALNANSTNSPILKPNTNNIRNSPINSLINDNPNKVISSSGFNNAGFKATGMTNLGASTQSNFNTRI